MQPSSRKEHRSEAISVLERRTEIRHPAEGEVILAPESPRPSLVEGRLIDISERGFRVAHDSASFEAGSLVHFRHAKASGVARVAWNLSAGGRWQSGFLILQE